MPFTKGQHVRMLVACEGEGDDEEEHVYPPGTAGRIDDIDSRGIHHVEVGTGDSAIVVCFDRGEEADRSMQALEMPARIVANPVNGGGIVLTDGNGVTIGQLSLSRVAGGLATQQALRDRVIAAINAGQAERQVTHKNGTTYDVLPEALFQVSTDWNAKGDFPSKSRSCIRDGDPVIVYRNPEGMHFVRFPDEVVSPRFEEVKS